jgi:hypothetical protein
MPKWKFRLAPDIVVQIQPKPQRVNAIFPRTGQFECIAVGCANPIVEDFEGKRRGDDWQRMKFSLDIGDDEWVFRPRGNRMECPRPGAGESIQAFRDRIVGLLNGGIFATVRKELMFSFGCLRCGKALTDPASMARFIGPECAGTSSIHVPRIKNLVDGSSERAPAPRRQRRPKPDQAVDTASLPFDEPAAAEPTPKPRPGLATYMVLGPVVTRQLEHRGHAEIMDGLAMTAGFALGTEDEVEAFIAGVRRYFGEAQDELLEEDELLEVECDA